MSNRYGQVVSSPAILSVATSMPLATASEATNLTWSDGFGNTPWVGQTRNSHDGLGAARSGPVGNHEWSVLQADVTGPGVITFWWEVSSEDEWDDLEFWIGDETTATISGEVDWNFRSFTVPGGRKNSGGPASRTFPTSRDAMPGGWTR